MQYVDEFRRPEPVRRLLAQIASRSRTRARLMEFCGGHTHAILKFGLRQLLPPTVQLLSGPGCPVCVTAQSDLDRAIALARQDGVILTTFGDMVRVPGSRGTLQEARARGADVRIVYSTLDALALARANPGRQVVFLAVGFETTAPTVAAAVLAARAEQLANFSVLCLHKLTPPAMQAILEAGEVELSGIIGPGHVTTVIGARAWEFLPGRYRISCAVAGFEPLDILRAVYALVDRIESGDPAVCNTYSRSVRPGGNETALRKMGEVFRVGEAQWRGLGSVPASGLRLRKELAAFDAAARFAIPVEPTAGPKGCRCGEVLRGVLEPPGCPLFGKACTPETPVGPCMVSGEGACGAYLQFADWRAT
ncbi:MAG: hydrogenase formation protein HypD [bacterium]